MTAEELKPLVIAAGLSGCLDAILADLEGHTIYGLTVRKSQDAGYWHLARVDDSEEPERDKSGNGAFPPEYQRFLKQRLRTISEPADLFHVSDTAGKTHLSCEDGSKHVGSDESRPLREVWKTGEGAFCHR